MDSMTTPRAERSWTSRLTDDKKISTVTTRNFRSMITLSQKQKSLSYSSYKKPYEFRKISVSSSSLLRMRNIADQTGTPMENRTIPACRENVLPMDLILVELSQSGAEFRGARREYLAVQQRI